MPKRKPNYWDPVTIETEEERRRLVELLEEKTEPNTYTKSLVESYREKEERKETVWEFPSYINQYNNTKEVAKLERRLQLFCDLYVENVQG